MRFIRLAVASLFIVLSACPLGAQNIGATLEGTVTDDQHAVLPGVSVTITNVDTGIVRSVVTDVGGGYRAPALPPGAYELRAELTGFTTYRRTGLTLTIGQESRIDFTLQVASVKETVEVTGGRAACRRFEQHDRHDDYAQGSRVAPAGNPQLPRSRQHDTRRHRRRRRRRQYRRSAQPQQFVPDRRRQQRQHARLRIARRLFARGGARVRRAGESVLGRISACRPVRSSAS